MGEHEASIEQDPRFQQWRTQQSFVLLLTLSSLIVPLFPAFHFVLGLLAERPPDSLPLRLAAAGLSASLAGAALLFKRLRAHASLLQVVNLGAVLIATLQLIIDSGYHYAYIASGLLCLIGSSLAFVSLRHLLATYAAAVLFQAWHALSSPRQVTPLFLVSLLTYATAALIIIVLTVVRARAARREFATRLALEEQTQRLNASLRDIERLNQQIEAERQRAEELLLNMLPFPIAQRLKQGERVIADGLQNVTVLFADIVGFTHLASTTSAAQLVSFLNEVFRCMDALAERYGLEKIKTIGDCYMVVGGAPAPREDHTEAVADMALELLPLVASLGEQLGRPVQLRVGIHTGEAVAGIIGTKRYAYDLWGDTVNLASRMESHSLAGRIQCTRAVYERLKGRYEFVSRGTIEIKGKGAMEAFLLVGRKDSALAA